MKFGNPFLAAIILAVILHCVPNKTQADSYPSVHSIYAKGEYVFLNGFAHIRMIDGKISRLKVNEIDVQIIDRSVERSFNWSPESDLWGIKGFEGSTDYAMMGSG